MANALTPEQIKRLDRFLQAAQAKKPETWPSQASDWDDMRALQSEGVDLATAVGEKIKVPILHRLLKQMYRAEVSVERKLAAVSLLSELTEGRALHSRFGEAWSAMSLSFSAANGDKDKGFFQGLHRLFLDAQKRNPEGQSWNGSWMIAASTAAIQGNLELLEDIKENAPNAAGAPGGRFWWAIGQAQGPVAAWFMEHHAERLFDPHPDDPKSKHRLGDMFSSSSCGDLSKRFGGSGWQSYQREKALEAALDAPSPGRRFRL